MTFEIRDYTTREEKSVLLSIKISNWNDNRRYHTEICQDIPVCYLQYELETFFTTLLHHPDFPFPYPCYMNMDDSQSDAVYDQFEEKYGHLQLSDTGYEKLERQYIREHITKFNEEGIDIIQGYKMMLIEHRIPDGWTITRNSGPETHHDIF